MIKRIFLDWKRPFISQVAHYLWSGLARESSVPSFAGFTVVVSSSRAGRALLDRLTEKAPRGAMIPPRIVTVGALPELLLEEDPVFGHIDYASRAEELAAWMTAMQSLDPRERELLIPELPSTGAVDQWWRLAEEFQTLWRELASGGATFGDAARIAADTAMEKEESRFGALGHLFEACRAPDRRRRTGAPGRSPRAAWLQAPPGRGPSPCPGPARSPPAGRPRSPARRHRARRAIPASSVPPD